MAFEDVPLPLPVTLAAWAALGIGMALGRERGGRKAALLDPSARVGLGIQALAFAIVFAPLRPTASPGAVAVGLRWAGAALAWASAAFAIRAAHVLGRQWSLEARLLPEHRLVRRDRRLVLRVTAPPSVVPVGGLYRTPTVHLPSTVRTGGSDLVVRSTHGGAALGVVGACDHAGLQ